MKRIFPILCVGMGLVGFCATGHADSAAFGDASAFNLIALNGNIVMGSDVGGRVAASGTVSGQSYGGNLQNVTIGGSTDPWGALASGYEVVAAGGLVSGGNYNITVGNVWTTSTVTQLNNSNQWQISGGGIIDMTNNSQKVVTGSAASSPINFTSLYNSLSSLSGDLSHLTQSSNVSITSSGGPLVLSTTSKAISTYIFDITSAQFATSNGLNIEVPLGSTVLINVSGASASLSGSVSFNGNQESVNSFDSNGNITGGNNDEGKILFNFAGATTVNVGNELVGAVLAPNAAFTGSNQMGGTVIASSIDYNGEVHNVAFTGSLPSVPEGGSAWSFLLMAGLVSVGAFWWRKSSPVVHAA